MAIKKDFTIKGNVAVAGAYIKIGSIAEEDNTCSFNVYISKDKVESDAKNYADVIYGYQCPIVYNSIDFRKQCYESLKAREEFSGAVDILEQGQVA